MTLPDLSDPVAARDVPAGEPIVPSAVSGATTIPEGWWSVPVPLPATAVPGTPVHLVDADLRLRDRWHRRGGRR